MFYFNVTLNFDLLTPESDTFISVRKCTDDVSLVKVRLDLMVFKISCQNCSGYTNGRTDTWTGQKHNAPTTLRGMRHKNRNYSTGLLVVAAAASGTDGDEVI